MAIAPVSYEEQVLVMMGRRMPFARGEDAINIAEVPEDQRAALWLLAWSLREPWIQRRDVRLTAGSVGELESEQA